jgi:hypothetical protein
MTEIENLGVFVKFVLEQRYFDRMKKEIPNAADTRMKDRIVENDKIDPKYCFISRRLVVAKICAVPASGFVPMVPMHEISTTNCARRRNTIDFV